MHVHLVPDVMMPDARHRKVYCSWRLEQIVVYFIGRVQIVVYFIGSGQKVVYFASDVHCPSS